MSYCNNGRICIRKTRVPGQEVYVLSGTDPDDDPFSDIHHPSVSYGFKASLDEYNGRFVSNGYVYMEGLVFPGLVTAFGTYLLKTSYQGLPRDLEEAAQIDGCNIGQTFLFIMLPLTRSAMISLGIFTALFAFKDLMWPMIVCPSAETTTLSAGLAKMQGQYGNDYPTMMASAVLAIVPMIVIYIIFQKQFVEGIATSGGKL